MSTYDCPWKFKGEVFESEHIPVVKGAELIFVYLITDTINNKKYIGQKMFHGKKIVSVNKVKKKVKCESDWKKYFSSSETIKQQVIDIGSEHLIREIIYICCSKGQANYLETKLQFELNCLEHQDIWYNGIVNLRCKWNHLKLDKLVDVDSILLKSLYDTHRPSLTV